MAIPALGYFDDFGLVTPLPLTEEARLLFTELDEIFSIVLKLSKSEWGQISEFLGHVLDASAVPGGPPLLFPSQFRKDKLETQIYETRKLRGISSDVLRKSVW